MNHIIEHCNNLRENFAPTKAAVELRFPAFQNQSTQNQAPVDEVDNRDHCDYRMEEVRLRSYENWPVPYMDPGKMAAAGFYYTGEGDKVRCFECKVEICQWLEGDNPMGDHQRWQEQCRFVRKIPCGNVPIGENPSSIPQPRPRSHDVCGPYGIEIRPGSSPDSHSTIETHLPSSAKLGSLGIGRPKGPAHPEFASYDSRLRTFSTWPISMAQTKESLADAGFYYTGKGDRTLCYHCGGGLNHWEPNDDPWEQHAKWFTKCYYLLMVKGQAYINSITGQTMAPLSTEETMQMNLPSYIKKVEAKTNPETEKVVEKLCDAGPSSVNTNAEVSKPEMNPSEKPKVSSVEAQKLPETPSNKPVDDVRMCKICYSEELGVVFLPCGHMVACVKCAPGMTTCALCRQSVSMTVRAFLS